MKPRIKFQCNTHELVAAVERVTRLARVVVDSPDDVEGLIRALLGVIHARHVDASAIRCQLADKQATIELQGLTREPMTAPGLLYEAMHGGSKQASARAFIEEVEALQRMIEGTSGTDPKPGVIA